MSYETASLHTKKALAEALKVKMKSKPFSKITVSEIIAECGVNRKTFYYHFEDIYALLKWMFEEEAIEVVKQFDLLVDYEETIGFIFDYINNNRDILQCTYNSIGRDVLKRFFYSDFIGIMTLIVSSAEEKFDLYLDGDLKRYYCDFLTEALAGMLINHIAGEYSLQRQQIIENISVIVRSSIKGFLTEKGKPAKK